MPFYYDFTPKDGEPALPRDEILARVVVAFPCSRFDRGAAVAEAADRLKHLTALNAPEEILACYREPNVVRCWVGDTDPEACLEFDVWEGKEMTVYAEPEDSPACEGLLQKLASVLNYHYVREEYD